VETSIEVDTTDDTNLNGFLHKSGPPHMLRRQYGKIANIACGGQSLLPGFATYSASKAGIVSFSKVLSEEVKYKNINVNSVYLGLTNTEYTRERINSDAAVTISLDEMMQPPEVSKVVLFLVSDEAAPIKGAAVDIFGNRY
jgi:NAD(P)-dependent dehydrogenase (short-subunit alcohol dehydrogenase family)